MWRWKQPNTIQRHPKTKGSWNFASSSISPILIYSDHFDSFWTFSLNITAALFPKCLCFAGSPSSTWWWERNLSCCRGQCISGIPRPIFSAQRLAQGNTFFWITKSVNSQISVKPISHLKSIQWQVRLSSMFPKIPMRPGTVKSSSGSNPSRLERSCWRWRRPVDGPWCTNGELTIGNHGKREI